MLVKKLNLKLNINIRAKDAEQYVTAIDKAKIVSTAFLYSLCGFKTCEGPLNTLKMDDLNGKVYVTVNLILTSDIFIGYLINEPKKVSADGAIRLLVDGYNSSSDLISNL